MSLRASTFARSCSWSFSSLSSSAAVPFGAFGKVATKLGQFDCGTPTELLGSNSCRHPLQDLGCGAIGARGSNAFAKSGQRTGQQEVRETESWIEIDRLAQVDERLGVAAEVG